MNTLIKLSYVIIIATLISCHDVESDPIPDHLVEIEIPSVLLVYPELSAEAEKWDTNSELEQLIIELEPSNAPINTKVAAFFISPDKGTEYLMIRILSNNSSTSTIGKPPFPKGSINPIELANLHLDSIDAWNVFLQNPDIRSLDQKHFECGSLLLTRGKKEGQSYVIWRLQLSDCTYTNTIYFTIDAITGEYIEFDSH